MMYSGVNRNTRASSGMSILTDSKWNTKIHSYTYINYRIIIVRCNVCRGHLTVIGVYAPEEGKMEETEIFYDTLQKQVQNCTKSDYVVVAGDLNARVRKQPIPNTIGIFGENHINKNGQKLREFATYNDLKITNTFFQEKRKYVSTLGVVEDQSL
jgi:hypothetical protein